MKNKRLFIVLLFLIGIVLIGYGSYTIISNKTSESGEIPKENEDKDEYVKLDNESNEDAFKRFCLEYTKKDECKTNDISIEGNVYKIEIPYDEIYNQLFAYDFSSNKYEWSKLLKPGATPDEPPASGGK